LVRLATVLGGIGVYIASFFGHGSITVTEYAQPSKETRVYTVVALPKKERKQLQYVAKQKAQVKREAWLKPSPSRSRAYARTLVTSPTQFKCLNSLWTKESGWRHNADNPYSSAYGIPQALPGNKMEIEGSDWRTNPVTQVDWGLRYIKERYGSPCQAYAHFKKHNWY
jgi:hypothetical protein